MYVPLKVTTDFSLLKSTIKIDELISFLKQRNITSVAICDDYLYGVMEFYTKCLKEQIKPIIGLSVEIEQMPLYLYAKNYEGYQNLLKIHTMKTEHSLSQTELKKYAAHLLAIIPYESIELYSPISTFLDTYIGYQNQKEKVSALLESSKIVFVNNIRALRKNDTKMLDYLQMIAEDKKVANNQFSNYNSNYFIEEILEEDEKTTQTVANLLNVTIPMHNNYIPVYDENLTDSFSYLEQLTKKGLKKRLNGNIKEKYEKRLAYELNVIKKMGFVDYILIVYDYVLYAKKNHIFVGPGRGSAVGSLVCYTLGITDLDPLEYNLLFERFLNPERITMPDIDIDFENTKRGEIIEYIKSRYGTDKVASIMTFATLKSKLALREVARIFDYNDSLFDEMIKKINANLNLHDNLENIEIKQLLIKSEPLKQIYQIAMHLEGLKKNISTHAAGVVISKVRLDDVIPIIKMGESTLTGVTMDYLESLGLLKMDLLAIKNLTIISNILELIKKDTGKQLDLNRIPLNDPAVLALFAKGDTTGIFQFESSGMQNFLQKLKPRHFNDLIASLALYRPGPMDNINTYIKRKEKKEKINYLSNDLEPILKETEGIIVYQEQVMQILVKVGGYSYAEADLIRRAMSKKKKDIIEQEKDKFISRALKNGYPKNLAVQIYEWILKFAGYGFNKSHSVSYALIGYQMAYLKVKFPTYFITNLLNMSIGSEIKTNEYLLEAKKYNLKIKKPDINISEKQYKLKSNELILPFNVIKGLNTATIDSILEQRNQNGKFLDFIDFTKRMYNKNCNERILSLLIKAGVFIEFENTTTLLENLAVILNYAELASNIDESLLSKPVIKQVEEQENNYEQECYGFYISNHPTSKYQDKAIKKLCNIEHSFDQYIRCIVLIESIKRTKIKNNEEMAFLEASDETGSSNFVVFAKQIRLLDDLKVKDIVEIQGRVTKRYDKYQINVNNIIKK